MIVVVGERQGRGGTRRHLAALLGVDVATMLSEVCWINLWEIEGTRPERYVAIIESATLRDDAVLLLGRRVQNAFGLGAMRPLESVYRDAGAGTRLVAVPHPSGRNRWWNDREHEAEAHAVLGAVWGAYR